MKKHLVAIQWRQLLVPSVVAVAFLFLTPPRLLDGRYSIFELSLVVLALTSLVARFRGAGYEVPVRWPVALLILLGLMVSSTLWSSATLNTARDAIGFVALAIAAWVLTRNGPLARVVISITVAGVVIVAVSLIALAVEPGTATQRVSGAFEGIYGNRNQLGFVMLQCLVAAIAIPARRRSAWLGRAALVALFFGVIVASQSRTSLIAAALVLVVWGFLVLVNRSRRLALIGLAVAVAVAIAGGTVALINAPILLDVLGKDETLNGRFSIWAGLWNLITTGPLLGFGFLREWPGWSAQSAAVANELDGLAVVHAHNEILSWWSGVGVLGVVAIVALYGFVYWAGWKVYRQGTVLSAVFAILVVFMMNIHGLTSVSETNAQGWFVFMLAVFACSKYVVDVPGVGLTRWVIVGAAIQPQTAGIARESEGVAR
jgi:O-antigen ligase